MARTCRWARIDHEGDLTPPCPCAREAYRSSTPLAVLEHPVKVYHILFIVWGIVFAFWLARQFSASNKRNEDK
jgi:hypothetical protein